MRRKGFATTGLLLLIIGLLVGGVAVFAYTQLKPSTAPNVQPSHPSITSPTDIPLVDEAATWKIYKNNKVGFQFKYPFRYSEPGIPSGIGGSPKVLTTGEEDDTTIFVGDKSTDSVFLAIFPYTGNLNDLVSTEQARGFLHING